ncbi:hypothetical protein [Desulfobacula sp.]|uniref:DUF6115 domain-containing protein n=1 Tax=Desulfobacula sp. TaxID=2593537 RepID=UPI002624BF59|nr:hypothetical protein [Desulfobacula sp.]
MIDIFSIEFWMGILFFVNFFLIIFLFVFVKKINRLNLGEAPPPHTHEDDGQVAAGQAGRSAGDIIRLLEPLVQESRNAAISFDQQITEKKRVLKELNTALDSRIISLNLVLSRAETLKTKLEERQGQFIPDTSSYAVLDHQNQIIGMYNQNLDINAIADRLAIPKGEVQLVIDLKKKFMAMEKKG